jgi:hypothetical protein
VAINIGHTRGKKQKTQHTQAKTNTANKTRAIPQTTGGEEESNIVFMRTSQNGT